MDPNISLRLADKRDAEGALEIYTPYILNTPITFETKVPTLSAMAYRIGQVIQVAPWLVCENTEGICGFAYAAPHRVRTAYRWSREVSVYVKESYQRQGLARALYAAILEIIMFQGYTNALAGITLPNPGSVAFHESFGFNSVGVYHSVGFKFGEWHDVGWWELNLNPTGAKPGEIASLSSVVECGKLEEVLDGACFR